MDMMVLEWNCNTPPCLDLPPSHQHNTTSSVPATTHSPYPSPRTTTTTTTTTNTPKTHAIHLHTPMHLSRKHRSIHPRTSPACRCHLHILEEKPLPPSSSQVDISELPLLIYPSHNGQQCPLLQEENRLSRPPCFISRLPYELLSEIFLYCLPSHQFLIPSRVQAPLLLTQICAFWRSIALSTPALWTSLHVNYHDPARDIASTNLWLSRSANLPLSLSLSIDFNEQRHQAIINALQAHSSRWHHIRFDFRHLLCPPRYSLGRATGKTPLLQTFQFHASDISNDNLTQITTLLTASPALREVSWIDDLANTETMLELPLSRLTRLSLAMARGTLDYLEVLDQCSNLEHIRITRPCANALPPRPPLLLAKLASLNISYDLTSILDHLVLPALKHVRVHAENDRQYGVGGSGIGIGSGATWSPETFLSLIDRSECSILTLSINAPMTEDALVDVVQRTSGSLTQLSITGIPVTDKLLRLLTPPIPSEGDEKPEEGEYLCPVLDELVLDTKVTSTSGQLAHMIETRLALGYENSPPDPGGATATASIPVRKITTVRILDGPRDIIRLQELKDERKLGALEIFPRKESKQRRRNFLYRRKVSSSR